MTEHKTDAVQQTVSALALAIMQESLAAGKAIEIPALGIEIKPEQLHRDIAMLSAAYDALAKERK